MEPWGVNPQGHFTTTCVFGDVPEDPAYALEHRPSDIL